MNNIIRNTLICLIVVVIVILCLIPVIIVNVNKSKAEKEERQAIFSALECWAEGQEYKGKCIKNWRNDIEHTNVQQEIEPKAIEIVRKLKDDPAKLAFFLDQLENHMFIKQSIKDELSNLALSIEDKIIIAPAVFHYSLQITKSEVEAYVSMHGSKELHLQKGTGGYYDESENSSSSHTTGIEGSQLNDSISFTYFGDFKCVETEGVNLDSFYQENKYYTVTYYFRGDQIDFNPRKCDCYYSGKYLFGINNIYTYVYDTETKCTYQFNN